MLSPIQVNAEAEGARLAEVGAQEEAACGVLHALAHFHQVLKDVLSMRLLGTDEAGAHGAQQVPVISRRGKTLLFDVLHVQSERAQNASFI